MELKSLSEDLVSQFLKDSKFRTQALEVHLTSMDDKVSKPVAVFCCDSAGGWEFVSETNREVQSVIEKCEEQRASTAHLRLGCFQSRGNNHLYHLFRKHVLYSLKTTLDLFLSPLLCQKSKKTLL